MREPIARRRWQRTGRWLPVVGFLAPNAVGFLAFLLFPVVFSFVMAFTNWSLRPQERPGYVGLRNFVDLLGIRELAAPEPALALTFSLAAAGLVAGIVLALWANVANWRGTQLSAVVVGVLGLTGLIVAVVAGHDSTFGWWGFWFSRWQSVALAGLVALLVGLLALGREEADWRPGAGALPGLIIAAAALTLGLLHSRMFAAYELRDYRFWLYFENTVFLMVGIPFSIAGSLGLALLLNHQLPAGPWRRRLTGAGVCAGLALTTLVVGVAAGWPNAGLLGAVFWLMAGLGFAFNIVSFRTIYYLPTFTAGVAVFILWKALYNRETGPINQAIEGLGRWFGVQWHGPGWLVESAWAKPSLILMGMWIAVGGMNMLLYLAALSNVPQELLEAAEVDGAGPWQRFRHVTLPQLAPTTFFISVMSIIGGLQGGFEQARVMTEGGPSGSTTTLSYYIYNKMYNDLDLGYAAAISWVLFGLIFVATAINWKFGRGLEVEL